MCVYIQKRYIQDDKVNEVQTCLSQGDVQNNRVTVLKINKIVKVFIIIAKIRVTI